MRKHQCISAFELEHGGAGDSSILTAWGVFQGMRAAAEVTWGAPTLHGRTVGVAGVGKVGHHLVTHLVDDGASVVVTDVDPEAVARVQAEHPDVSGLTALPSPPELGRSKWVGLANGPLTSPQLLKRASSTLERCDGETLWSV